MSLTAQVQPNDDSSGVLSGFFGLLDKGLATYTAYDQALDRRASQPAQTSISPTGTTVNAAGNIAVNPQTLVLVLGAVVLVGVLVVALRK